MSAPTISAQFLRHVANCLELTGGSPDPLLAAIGLGRDELDDPDRHIPLGDFLSFFEAAALHARNPHFGLHVGRLVGSDSLGALSFLFLSAPTLREAFHSFTRYLDTMQGASRNEFALSGGSATFTYAVLDQHLTARRQDAEYSIGATYTLASQFTAGELVLDEVRFEHEMVGDYARYRDYFGCDVFFEQDRNSLSFAAGYLDRRGRSLSPVLHPIIEGHLRLRARGGRGDEGFAGEIASLLRSHRLDVAPTRREIAARLEISPATLGRRMKAAGLVWRELVANRRMEAAARLLLQSRREIADIALAVGYGESASFIRGFRRHFGTTPLRYRRGMRDSGASADAPPSEG